MCLLPTGLSTPAHFPLNPIPQLLFSGFLESIGFSLETSSVVYGWEGCDQTRGAGAGHTVPRCTFHCCPCEATQAAKPIVLASMESFIYYLYIYLMTTAMHSGQQGGERHRGHGAENNSPSSLLSFLECVGHTSNPKRKEFKEILLNRYSSLVTGSWSGDLQVSFPWSTLSGQPHGHPVSSFSMVARLGFDVILLSLLFKPSSLFKTV